MKLWGISFALAGLCMIAGAVGGLAVWGAMQYVSIKREAVPSGDGD